MDLSNLITKALQGNRVEPVKRMVGGSGPRYAIHRFPIKGGITMAEVLADNLSRNNPLLARIAPKKD